MTGSLDHLLAQVGQGCGASAAVIWFAPKHRAEGTVVASWPAGLLAPGTPWPRVPSPVTAGIVCAPAGVAARVPPTLGLRLPAPARAAAVRALGDGGLFLLLTWSDPPSGGQLTADQQQIIHGQLATLAVAVEGRRVAVSETARLRAVFDGLDVGVVSVDSLAGTVRANRFAASLLGLPDGEMPVSDFSAAMAALGSRALNHAETLAANARLHADPNADIDFMWRFGDKPTHIQVVSSAVDHTELHGRVWVFFDDSARASEFHASERARALLRATTDAMLDPQILVGTIRDQRGRVVDFTHLEVNPAACDYLGLGREELIGHNLLETFPNLEGSGLLARYARCAETGEPVILDDFPYFNEILDAARHYDIRAARAAVDTLSVTWRDVTERNEAARRVAESEEHYRLLAENVGEVVALTDANGIVRWVSPSVQQSFGGTPTQWEGRAIQGIVLSEDLPIAAEAILAADEGAAPHRRIRVIDAGGAVRWTEFTSKRLPRAGEGPDGYVSTFRVIDDEVSAEQQLDEARRKQAAADALYRRSMESAAVGMFLARPEGPFLRVNQALCDFFGYEAETLLTKTWIELTAPEYLDANLANVAELVAGRIPSYQVEQQYIRADGQRIWGQLSLGCLRDPDGTGAMMTGYIVDITDRVRAQQRLSADLDSAAGYLRSILPGELSGAAQVSARYLPSQHLGGDCYDYRWVDDDHLIVYLFDVSGHGIEAALLAVSVHNLLRSGSLSTDNLLHPDQVLAELNTRFPMDANDGHFFTIWYGVYQKSTRTLTHANAGHPPALTLIKGQASPLPASAPPIGVFDDTAFPTATHTVPHDSRILLYSDGAYEFPLPTGEYPTWEEFIDLYTALAATPHWSLDNLVAELRSLTATGDFTDDCALVELYFDGPGKHQEIPGVESGLRAQPAAHVRCTEDRDNPAIE